jgi:hypothetical protein
MARVLAFYTTKEEGAALLNVGFSVVPEPKALTSALRNFHDGYTYKLALSVQSATTGYRLPDDTLILFTPTCPTSGPTRIQLESRLARPKR